MADVKITALPAAGSVVPGTDVLPLVTGGGAVTSKATPSQLVTAALTTTKVTVAQGGTGVGTLTGYVIGNGTSDMTAVTTIPNTAITGLGTISTQASSNVAITGGAIDGTTIGATTASTGRFTTELVGSAATSIRFPNTLLAVSGIAGVSESGNIGILGESAGAGGVNGVGIYGVGYASTSNRGTGVTGEGHVTLSTDSASAVGIRGYSNDTHASGLNIGLFADANGSSIGNYGLYINSGNIFTAAATSWYLNGNLTINGSGGSYSLSATNGATIAATTATTAVNLSGTQTSHYVYAAPSGSNGTASFRALTSTDLPVVPYSEIYQTPYAASPITIDFSSQTAGYAFSVAPFEKQGLQSGGIVGNKTLGEFVISETGTYRITYVANLTTPDSSGSVGTANYTFQMKDDTANVVIDNTVTDFQNVPLADYPGVVVTQSLYAIANVPTTIQMQVSSDNDTTGNIMSFNTVNILVTKISNATS